MIAVQIRITEIYKELKEAIERNKSTSESNKNLALERLSQSKFWFLKGKNEGDDL